MSIDPEIRQGTPGDLPALMALYPAAFPDEDLLAILRSLLAEPAGVLSLVAVADGVVAGHVLFTDCSVAGSPARVALLGPLAVAPARQRQGIGRALVEAGLARLGAGGTAAVFVLGDPAYYGRLGFRAERGVTTPSPIPAEWADAWQSIRLDGGASPLAGPLTVPAPWRDPALWSD